MSLREIQLTMYELLFEKAVLEKNHGLVDVLKKSWCEELSGSPSTFTEYLQHAERSLLARKNPRDVYKIIECFQDALAEKTRNGDLDYLSADEFEEIQKFSRTNFQR